jgi:hypothetical protein
MLPALCCSGLRFSGSSFCISYGLELLLPLLS